MEINKIIDILGSQTALAKAMGVSNNAVSKWVAQGYVPPGRAMNIYKLTEGLETSRGESISLEKLLQQAQARGGPE